MPPINIDLSEAEKPPFAAGTEVTLRVEKLERKTSERTGNQFIAWEFIVVDPMEDPPRKLFENTMLTPQNAQFRTARVLRALGVPFGKETKDDPALQGGFDDMLCVGKTCRALLKIEDDAQYGPRNVVGTFSKSA